MTTSLLRRGGAIAAVTVALTFGLSACGDDENDATGTTPSDDSSMTTDAGADTFGAACSAVPEDGAGSFNGMATAPVATAASANPVLETLVTAVTKAELVDTLNSGEAWTVLAPTNDAFGKIPAADLEAVLADKDTLTKILTYHVIPGKLSPDELAGTHKTVQGGEVTIEGSGEDFTADGSAKVVCGNVQTANATVYIIDTVLMPKS